MPQVAIVTDSVATVPDEMMEELKINWVPYYIHRGNEVLRDLITVKRKEFFEWLPTAKELPKTANPSAGEYLEKYKSIAEKGIKKIASIHISSVNSGAFQAANMAKSMLKEIMPDIKVEVIDSWNASMCQGWMVIEAARAALKGATLTEVKDLVEKMVPLTKMLQTADTLRYLYLGGRIGKAKHIAATALNIKPIIGIEEGLIVPLGQARTRKKVYAMMVDKLDKAVGQGAIKIAYVYAAALEETEKLRVLVEQKVEVAETFIAEPPPALGVHTGPGTVGFCYYPVTD